MLFFGHNLFLTIVFNFMLVWILVISFNFVWFYILASVSIFWCFLFWPEFSLFICFFAVGHSQNVRLVFLLGFSVFNDFDFGHHFQFSVVLNTLCDFSISSPLFIINYQHFSIFSFFFLSCQGFAIFCILFPFCFLF